MKKILVSYLGTSGGTNLYAYEMAKGLIDNNQSVYALISRENKMLTQWKELSFQKLVIIPTYSSKITCLIRIIKFLFLGEVLLRKEFKDINIDVIYIPALHILDRFIPKIFDRAKCIITDHDPIAHSSNSIFPRMMWYFNRIYLRQADEIILLSEKFRSIAIKNYNKNPKNVHVIPHGVFDYYTLVENKKGNKNVIEYNKKYNFLFFGRIEKYKGLHILSKAYKLLSNKYENISLTIVGNGNFKEYEKEYINLENIRIVNRWINDDEVNSFFRGKNIITVLPYLDATQSGVINIAMLNKSLVITTDVGGLSEQVKNKYTGLLVEPNNVKALTEVMEFAINNIEVCFDYINNAYNEVQNLQWKNLSKKLINIIEKS